MAKTIMVVDDSATIRQSMRFNLTEAGYEVKEADSGVSALKILDQDKVDVIITDLNMDQMNGLELIRKIRAGVTNKYTPILMLTTESLAEKKAEGKAAGATGWIVKPVRPEVLLATLDKVMR